MTQKNYKEYVANIIPCVCYGIIGGTLTGATIFLFKFLAKHAEELSRSLYGLAKGSWLTLALTFLILVALAFLMSKIHKAVPECKGGGIPRSEGILRGVLSFRWLKTLLATFFGSLLSFFAGLPVGSEGPAVLIGTSIGHVSGCFSKKRVAWSRYLMTGSAGAGFAVATGAPLSGILFALEEIHKRFSPMLVLTVSMSVLSATYTNQLLCNAFHLSPMLFEIAPLPAFELSHAGYLLLLGLLIALAVGIFDASILLFRRYTSLSKKAGKIPVKLIIVFTLAGILALFFSDSVYSGHHLILHILSHDMTTLVLLALFLLRLVMMLLITDSGATGGIFIPTLAIGALAAALIAKLLILFGMPAELSSAVILLGMCAFIGGTLRAPLTASVLFLELTGQFTGLFFVALVIFSVSFITELFNLTPFYDKALEEMTEVQNHGKEAITSYFKVTVSADSFVVGKAVRDIMWPASALLISITKAKSAHTIQNVDAEQRIDAGDTVVIRATYYDKNNIIYVLYGLVGKHHKIEIE